MIRHMVRTILLLAGFLSLLCSAGYADERILSYDTFVRVNFNGSMDVTENIRVRSERKKIKRGIYRDFPTRYRDRAGNNFTVGFRPLRVLRNGSPEPYSLEHLRNGVRIRIGRRNVFIPPGIYTYTITYATDRQLGYFKNFDELYWNVTGNGWGFPIDRASCKVILPADASDRILEKDATTGPKGARGKNFITAADQQGHLNFTTTAPLGPHEGLTILVKWPKGYVAQPTLGRRVGYLFADNAGLLVGLLGMMVILGYYFFVWNAVGRDPQKGVIIPLYEPDPSVSPAAARYLMRMGYDDKVLTAAIIDMAVKGYLTIGREEEEYVLELTGRGLDDLSREETAVAQVLFENGSRIALKDRNHMIIHEAVVKLKGRLKDAYEATYFITNRKYFFRGAGISLAVLLVTEFFQAGSRLFSALFITAWLSLWSVGVFALGLSLFHNWRVEGNKTGAIGLTLFSLPFFLGELFGLGILAWATSFYFLLIFTLVIFINVLFYFLLKAPTVLGRKVMDRIEGFRMYLSVAEKGELKTATLSPETPELYERYLPYALALDVEQQWSQRFADALSREAPEGRGYHPSWFSSLSMAEFDAGRFASCLSGSFAGAVSSSGVAPGSSSGGGGGGSSGGGGGGGGGGW